MLGTGKWVTYHLLLSCSFVVFSAFSNRIPVQLALEVYSYKMEWKDSSSTSTNFRGRVAGLSCWSCSLGMVGVSEIWSRPFHWITRIHKIVGLMCCDLQPCFRLLGWDYGWIFNQQTMIKGLLIIYLGNYNDLTVLPHWKSWLIRESPPNGLNSG